MAWLRPLCPHCGFDDEWNFYVFLVEDRIVRVEPATGAYDFARVQSTYMVTVQVVTTGITPQLATSARLREAEKELLHPVRRLHTQWSGTPRRYAAVASTWPRPSLCFRQSASPPRSACQSSPYARARRDGSPLSRIIRRFNACDLHERPQRLTPLQDVSTRPRGLEHTTSAAASNNRSTFGAVGSCRTETSSVAACPRAPDATT